MGILQGCAPRIRNTIMSNEFLMGHPGPPDPESFLTEYQKQIRALQIDGNKLAEKQAGQNEKTLKLAEDAKAIALRVEGKLQVPWHKQATNRISLAALFVAIALGGPALWLSLYPRSSAGAGATSKPTNAQPDSRTPTNSNADSFLSVTQAAPQTTNKPPAPAPLQQIN